MVISQLSCLLMLRVQRKLFDKVLCALIIPLPEGAVSGRGCLQGPVALTHQPNCPLCSFSFKIVGDVGCSCEIVKSCVRCRGHGASHIFESHFLDSFQSFSVGFVLHSSDPHDRTVG